MYVWSALSEEYVSTGYGCQPCSSSAEQMKMYFPPVAIGSTIPSDVSLLILHTQAESIPALSPHLRKTASRPYDTVYHVVRAGLGYVEAYVFRV